MGDKYIVRLLGKSEFEDLFKGQEANLVYKFFGDDMCLLAEKIPDDPENENWWETVQSRAFIQNIDEIGEKERFFKIALYNTRERMPARLYCTEHIAEVDPIRSGVFMESRPILYDGKWKRRGFRLTNTLWIGGAVSAFYPGVLRRLFNIMGEEYFLTFPSRHEARVHPVSKVNADEVHEALLYYNYVGENGSKSGGLSNKVYRYSQKRSELQEVYYPEWKDDLYQLKKIL